MSAKAHVAFGTSLPTHPGVHKPNGPEHKMGKGVK